MFWQERKLEKKTTRNHYKILKKTLKKLHFFQQHLRWEKTMDNNVDSVNNTSTTTSNLTTKTLSSSSSSPAAASAAQTKQAQPPILVTTTNSFWKNSNRIVPGRPSPKRVNPLGDTVTGSGGVMMATFRDYQNSVSDAWDTGDDEFCIISSAALQQQQQNMHRSPDGTLSKTGKAFN